jgi:hypothetical protein
VNRALENPAIAHFWDPMTAAGRAALNAVITEQAQIIAYVDDYKLLMIATLSVLPLLVMFNRPDNEPAEALRLPIRYCLRPAHSDAPTVAATGSCQCMPIVSQSYQ